MDDNTQKSHLWYGALVTNYVASGGENIANQSFMLQFLCFAHYKADRVHVHGRLKVGHVCYFQHNLVEQAMYRDTVMIYVSCLLMSMHISVST